MLFQVINRKTGRTSRIYKTERGAMNYAAYLNRGCRERGKEQVWTYRRVMQTPSAPQ